MEEWRDVVGYEGLYQISDLGRVKSYHNKNGRGFSAEGHMFTPKIDKDGYHEYILSNNRKVKYKRGHRLVAEAFILNPNNLPQINHINGIKDDNRVENLEWVNAKDNVIHAWETGLKDQQREINSVIRGYKCYLINIYTKEKLRFNSHSKLSIFLGYNRGWLSKVIKEDVNYKDKILDKGYIIELEVE